MFSNLLLLVAVVIAASTLPSLVYSQSQDRCQALVLKGGANRGSYEAGAIHTFVKHLRPEEVRYDVVTGVSVGALNAAFVASFPKGSEQQMTEELTNMWLNVKTERLYKSWWGGIIDGMFFKKGVYDNTPLVDYAREVFANKTFNRKLSFTAVDANTGQAIRFDESISGEDFITALIGSTSMPFIFPYRNYKDKVLIDGGAAWNLDVGSAITRCSELVDDESQIVIDVIDVGQQKTLAQYDEGSSGNAVSYWLRRNEIKKHYQGVGDMIEIKRAHPRVNFRYVVVPEKALESEMQILSFDTQLVESMMERGKKDAERAIGLKTDQDRFM